MVSVSKIFIKAFNYTTRGKKPHVYKRLGDTCISGLVGLAKTNYFRSLNAIKEIGIDGYTFIVLKSDIDNISGMVEPKKGDIIEHKALGVLTVDLIEKLIDADEIFAYRIVTV